MSFLFSPKKGSRAKLKKAQGPSEKFPDVALSERPLTIGCCQPPTTVSPSSEMKQTLTDDPRSSKQQPSSLSVETSYEGQGASPRRLLARRQNTGWWGSPLPLDPILAPSHRERGSRKWSGQSSGSSATDDTGLSVIDKEELLDTIFVCCDTEGKGRVPVSRVIEHIKMITEANKSGRDIDELALQLDPTGLDLEIDLPTYQNRISQWIKNVQNQRGMDLSGAMDGRADSSNAVPMVSTPDIAPHWKTRSLDGGAGHHLNVSTPLTGSRAQWKTRHTENLHLFSGLLDAPLDLSACSYGSLEAEGGDSAPDMADLQNRIEDLQFQIRKLTEHNMKLQMQIETTDEANEQLMSQIDTLKGELKSLQQAWNRSQSIRDENEELKLTNKEWQKKHAQLEKDKRKLDEKLVDLQAEANKKQALETKLQAVEEQLSISLADADSMQEEHRRLQIVLQEYKHRSEETETHLEVKNAELAEKAKRCEEMQANLEELYSLNRVLKSEKTQLEVKLSEVRQELDSYQTRQLITPSEEVCSMSPTSSPKTELGLGRSLHSELRSLVSADGNLPSPICGNEDFDFENHIGSNSNVAPETPLSRQLSCSSSCSSASVASQLPRHFQKRKQEVMKQLQVFLEENVDVLQREGVDLAPKVAFTQLLDTELDSMIEKMASLSKNKKQLEQRANKLSFMLQSLQDDYVRITKKYEEAIKHCKELTATKSQLEVIRSENETLRFDVDRGKQKTEELEKDLSSCQQDLETAHMAQQKYRQMAETQLGELRRLFKEMEKKYKIAQDNARKKETVFKAKVAQQAHAHRAQLNALLDLVTSRDNHQDQPSPPQVAVSAQESNAASTRSDRQVLETVSAYLTGLKTQLAKVKGQLISLKREKFSLEHRPLRLKRTRDLEGSSKQAPATRGCFCPIDKDCSVLLDALTLEVTHEASQGHSNCLLLQRAQLPQQQPVHCSQDDSLVDGLRYAPATVIEELCHNLIRDFKTQRKRIPQTVSTQTEIPRTPDRQVRPYSRSSYAQTGLADSHNRETDTQTEADSADEFQSSSLQTTNGAEVKQAYLVNRPPTLSSAILLPVEEAFSPGDSASDLSDSFVTAFSSPVSCSPLRGSFRGSSLERDDLSDFLASPFSRTSSLESPHATPDQEPSDSQEAAPKIPVVKPDVKLPSLHRKSAQDRQEAAQRMADMLANSYARPNIVVEGCQADSEDNDLNANYDRSGKYSSSSPRKSSPARLKRRSYLDKEKDKRTSSLDGKSLDVLLSSNLPEVDMTEEEKEFSQRLLEASKKASERHRNRRGRKFSPSASPDQRSLSPSSADRSRSASPAPSPSPIPSPLTADDSTPLLAPAETPASSVVEVTDPVADKVTEGTTDSTGELQEERTGAEGESDKEDNKLTPKSERKDSEVEVFDIKADILKATASLQVEMPQVKPIVPLAQLREEHKQHRKTNLQFTMPELTEATELDQGREMITPSAIPPVAASLTTLHPTPVPGSPGPETPHKSREDSTTVGKEEEGKDAERSSASSDEKSLIPDSVLQKLGLKGAYSKDINAMTENEVEEKFNCLQMAFKASQYTLEQRVVLQHRQRDLAEKNIEKEIEGLLQTLQMLEPLGSVDTVSRDYIGKIKQHVEVLQSCSLRLSSKAEGFGAVQQEGRLSKATDVMITHVENLKRLFEREHAELEDARKLLQENRKLFRGNSITNNLSIDGEPDSKLLSRRALSMSGSSSKSYGHCEIRKRSTSCSLLPRLGSPYSYSPELTDQNQTGRRRASVATVVGSGLLSSSYGSQPLSFGGHHSRSQTEPSGISLGQGSRLAGGVRRTSVQLSSSLNTEDFKEAKARLTGSLSSGTISRHTPLTRTDSSVVVSRRASDDSPTRHTLLDGTISAPSLSPSSPLPSPNSRDAVSLPATPMVSTFPKMLDQEAVKKGLAKADSSSGGDTKNIKEDDVFHKGYEQGIRTQVTHELAELREQQKAFCESLEELIDHAEEEQEREETEKDIQAEKSNNKILRQLQEICQRWPRATRITRLILTVSVFLFALVYLFVTMVPLETCLQGRPVSYSPWRTLKDLLWPYTDLRHHTPPPK
ncbi:uncharacterized protein LOC110991183 [Acanthaster planci]|uniref:Uncharacterized protein LOC110991183 n=1 Tax=Acanthaster planci TaxID=133434 RepID=A0A8B8A346_ACAPL|nr:uncharacterized protein LOC110991183 [Acanthaster planci]